MYLRKFLVWFTLIVFLCGFLVPAENARAQPAHTELLQQGQVTAFDLILAINTLRTSYGLPALIEDPIVNAVAQSTAEIMAANQMSGHIGDVRGRIAAAGYGGGATVWATENFAVGNMGIDEIMVAWSDPDHMRPAVNPAYCHVGAGVARSSTGMTYYILQAAYTSANACGPYVPPAGAPAPQPGVNPVSQLIVPVKIATPDAEGKIIHVVEPGQSFWAIAVAYQITIRDIEFWNNLTRDMKLRIGQRLLIPGPGTQGYATPTPVGMIVPSTPDASGKIIHTVQAYNTLITIAEAYQVTVDTILALNGIQPEWPLQIGQKLLISPGSATPSATPKPLTPIEKLTPAGDGKYYHTVQSGESLSWIAGLYEISVAELMAWNGLNDSTIIHPGDQLLLQVTPPATITPTPGPPSLTPTLTPTQRPSTPTPAPALSPTATSTPAPQATDLGMIVPILVFLAAGGLILIGLFSRRRFLIALSIGAEDGLTAV